jgi:glutamine---fructose-6-phosphate transaminase (isomerizing)
MCGIAGTIFNENFPLGILVTLEDISKAFSLLEVGMSSTEKLLQLAWQYKSNVNFLRFCRNKKEQIGLKNICNSLEVFAKNKKFEISKINKKSSANLYHNQVKDYERILDAHWFLSFEVPSWMEKVEGFSSNGLACLQDSAVIFYKDLDKVIGAIDNRLEVRGRDSLGLSVVINSSNFTGNEICTHTYPVGSEPHYFEKHSAYGTYTFTFKTFNSIGELGDNANEIRRLIKENNFFLSLIEKIGVMTGTIMIHTRWASVGPVNLANSHPVNIISSGENNQKSQTLAMLNGDIYNYKEIIKDTHSLNASVISKSDCTSDCLAIPAALVNIEKVSFEVINTIASEFIGSFVIGVQHSTNPSDIVLVKKGIQGLYIGFSDDGFMFASDVYGLVETCRYFYPIDSDFSLRISAKKVPTIANINLTIVSHKTGLPITLTPKELKSTNITTRDIDKKGYKHFLEKEIYESVDIVDRTLSGYIQPEKSIDRDIPISAIIINDKQIPKFVINNLKDKKIKKIIITGMGTCYTAAVAISMYMRAKLKSYLPGVLIEPHIASEGSAFYLEPNMDDTLVIVIAQSGTTVDTNVYVQMAKERGAMSLAIANKREGDVTFIVDGTLYLGNGRDIEMAVPSTKTYTGQVILGYILSLYFFGLFAKTRVERDLFTKDLVELRESSKLIQNSLDVLNFNDTFEKINNFGKVSKSWYVGRDNSSNSVCADELRIKFSENCYQSVSSLSLKEIIYLNVKNSFITLITEFDLKNIMFEVKTLVKSKNLVTIIAIDTKIPIILQELIKEGSLVVLNMPAAQPFFSFLPTVLAGQFLSYYMAISLDTRKEYFVNLINALDSKEKLNIAWKKFNKPNENGEFNQGYLNEDLGELSENVEIFLSKSKDVDKSNYNKLYNQLDNLIQFSRRTIDTIKHQAKTITVGAVRDESYDQNMTGSFNFTSEKAQSNSKVNFNLDKLQEPFFTKDFGSDFLKLKNFEEILIACSNIDESYAYTIVNYVNELVNRLNVDKRIRLAQAYDYPTRTNKSNSFWIFLTTKEEKLNLNYHDHNQCLVFDFQKWHQNVSENNSFNLVNSEGQEFNKATWSLHLAIYLCKTFFLRSFSKTKEKVIIERIEFEIAKQLVALSSAISYVLDDKNILSELEYGAQLYLTRDNWKCIGSGVNYNLAKFTSKRLISSIGRACAFDVLENHKHIDMSAESAVIVFISNIFKRGYQEDAFSEIEKLVSHNNLPILITNIGDNRFDNFSVLVNERSERATNLSVPVIKIPTVGQQYSYVVNVLIIEIFIKKIKELIIKNN